MSYGFKTKLILDNNKFDLKAFSYDFDKEINDTGEVISTIQGGKIFLSLQDIPENSILEWGIKHRYFKSGSIRTLSNEDDTYITEEEIEFENAACINIKMVYQRNSTSLFTTLLTISPENICIGRNNCWINKEWTI